ncbi:hypothetical protein Hanom_Chr03g00209091 [Helianthus anomalus]
MSTSSKPEGSRKGKKSKSKESLRTDKAIINWKEDEFQQIGQNFQFPANWGAKFPESGSTVVDALSGYITLYGTFFKEGNFHLPITKFLVEVLTRYGFHISQVSHVGIHRITHFKFRCQAQNLIPTVEMFNVFYYVSSIASFQSFKLRITNVLPCSKDLPKSLHDWKHKNFCIRRGVIPIDMHFRRSD